MRKPTHVYVGYAPCGCFQAVASYSYKMRQSTATSVADMIRNGLIVHCLTWDEYQAAGVLLDDCPHGEMVGNEEMQLTFG